MADTGAVSVEKENARSSESGKDKQTKTSSNSKGKGPLKGTTSAKSGQKPSSSGTSKVSSTGREEEMMSILLAIRAEQTKTNEKMESFEKRIGDLESYDHTQYDYEGHYDEYPEDYSETQSVMGLTEDPATRKRKCDENNNDNESKSDSRFASLAKKVKTQEVCGKDVDPVLAEHVDNLFREGMQKENYDKMIDDVENSRPQNCQGLVTVRLNQLIWDIVSPAARTRDFKLKSIETSVVKAASILTKTVDQADKMEQNCKQSGAEFDVGCVIDRFNDAIALLGHANTQINMFRRDLLKPEMRNEYSHLCTHSIPFSDQLFGDDVSKTAKEIEECSRMGHKLQYNPYRAGYRGRPGLRMRFRGSRGSHRGGRGGMDFGHTMPKNSLRRGVPRRM